MAPIVTSAISSGTRLSVALATNSNGWARAVSLRRDSTVQRLGLATACAIVLSPLLSWNYCIAWLLVFFCAQLVERFIFEPMAKDPTVRLPLWREAIGGLCMFANAASFGALALPLWMNAGLVGGMCAILLLTASALHNTLSSSRSVVVLALSVFPQLLWLLATPVFLAALDAPPDAVTACLAAQAIFSYFCFLVWQRLQDLTLAQDRSQQIAQEQQDRCNQLISSSNQLVATVGHDLRTPLSTILTGAAQLEQAGVEKAARSHARIINDAGLMMKALLDDLLDHAKIEAGHLDVEVSDFDLRSLVRETLRLWDQPVRAKGLKLRLEGAHSLPRMVRSDPIRLRQILNNLISNALKFTQEGSITLSLKSWEEFPNQQALLFDVRDTGVGMSSAQMTRLFRPFDQTADGISSRYGGTGLGLSISLQLAELMGGRLTARSNPGSGSCFTLALIVDHSDEDAVGVELPQQVQAPNWTAPVPPEDEQPLATASQQDETPAPAAAQAPVVAEEAEETCLRVLVVDDHEINRRALQLILKPLGCQVTTAVDGIDALARCDDDQFDLIFMDVRMPELDGRETTRRLRAGASVNAAVPVIAVTADSSAEDIEKCMAVGMTYFVAKPVTPGVLVAAVNAVLGAADEASNDLQRDPTDEAA